MQMTNQKINLEILPEEARKELMDYYDYLINKYTKRLGKSTKKLKKALSKPVGILPENYRFNREEAHDR